MGFAALFQKLKQVVTYFQIISIEVPNCNPSENLFFFFNKTAKTTFPFSLILCFFHICAQYVRRKISYLLPRSPDTQVLRSIYYSRWNSCLLRQPYRLSSKTKPIQKSIYHENTLLPNLKFIGSVCISAGYLSKKSPAGSSS